MIDTSRWVISEVWLAMGLRILPAEKWDTPPGDQLQVCDETRNRFWYDGRGVWRVAAADREPALLGASTMTHELAHWLAASQEARDEINFGMSTDPYGNMAAEATSDMIEKGLIAAMKSCSHIVSMALHGRSA